ncbi:hypothetical protein [Candidatus Methanarcanum hacksteinii]|uniref:hypothetical protein n=1 Tax=Candidatus Methanarcanum hacksteinii TaxID=2911857 RepID=UPI0037DC3A4E
MDKKTKILTFAAVALMFAACFIGFVAINDGGVDADDTNAASVKIGDVTTEYATIEKAVKAAQPNNSGNVATVTLLKDVTTAETLPFTRSGQYILDIGEFTLTQGGSGYMISVGGSAPPVYPIDTINTSAQITIKGTGKIIANNTTFRSYGTMIFGENGVGPTVTMSNSVNSHSIFKVEEGSFLTINGGTFNLPSDSSNKVTRLMQNFGTTVINNGTFNGDIELWSCTVEGKNYDSTVTINEGTFNGKLLRQSDSDPQFVLDDKDKFIVKGGSFTDIANAVKYATSGATITLADDIELDERITVKNKAVTIDLNGKTITAAETFTSQCGAILVDSEGDLTIDDTSVNKTGGIDVYSETLDEDESAPIWGAIAVYPVNGHTAKLTVNAGEYKANYYAIVGSGNCTTEDRIEITINDGKFESPDGYGMYLPHVGITTINKGTFIAKDCAIEIRAGELSIKDGQFESTATEFSCSPNGNGTTTSGAVIAIAQHTTKKDITVNISGGVFEGLRALNESNPQNNNPAPRVGISITGGVFKGGISAVDSIDFIKGGSFSDLSGLAYVAEGKAYNLVEDCVVNSDITVKEKTILSVADGKSITIYVGKKLTIQKDATFNGTILGPNSNKLVANGMKAGEGGITITGGLLIINGKIMDAGGSEAGVTVTVTGNAIKVEGTLESGATMVIEEGTVVTVEDGKTFSSEGIIDNKGIITNDGVLTNDGTIKMTGASEITSTGDKKIVNNGIIIDNRNKGAEIVPIDTDSKGIVVSKKNSKLYEDEGFEAVAQDPDMDVKSEGTIEVDINKFAFIDPITTTGKLDIVMNDGDRQYTITIPKGTTIASGTVITVKFIEHQSFATKYYINTPGIENFSVKLPCQIGFKKAKVLCDDSELGISEVRYNKGTGYVTFDAAHNSVFTIVLSEASPANVTTTSGGSATDDYSLVIAFVVLVASLGFLVYVIRKKQ